MINLMTENIVDLIIIIIIIAGYNYYRHLLVMIGYSK